MTGLMTYFEGELLCHDCLVTNSLTLIQLVLSIFVKDASGGLTWPEKMLFHAKTMDIVVSGSVAEWNDLPPSLVSMS